MRASKEPKPKKSPAKAAGAIRIGVGGWTFPAWRSTFYPEKLPQHWELEYAASKLTSIEINGTYYRSLRKVCNPTRPSWLLNEMVRSLLWTWATPKIL